MCAHICIQTKERDGGGAWGAHSSPGSKSKIELRPWFCSSSRLTVANMGWGWLPALWMLFLVLHPSLFPLTLLRSPPSLHTTPLPNTEFSQVASLLHSSCPCAHKGSQGLHLPPLLSKGWPPVLSKHGHCAHRIKDPREQATQCGPVCPETGNVSNGLEKERDC